ncbi:MAG TPA: hypothetical protein ENI23_14260 [bacterium]|nr:hypothetical protein [bacterium]
MRPKKVYTKDNFDALLREHYPLKGSGATSEELIKRLEGTNFYVDPASGRFHNNYPGGLVDHSVRVGRLAVEKVERALNGSYRYNMLRSDDVPYPLDDPEMMQQFKTETLVAGLIHDFCKIDSYAKPDVATPKQIQYAKVLLQQSQIRGPDSMADTIRSGNISKPACSDAIEFLKENPTATELPTFVEGYGYSDDKPFGHGEKSVIVALQMGFELTEDQILAIRWHMCSWDIANIISGIQKVDFEKALNQSLMLKCIVCGDLETGFIYEPTL